MLYAMQRVALQSRFCYPKYLAAIHHSAHHWIPTGHVQDHSASEPQQVLYLALLAVLDDSVVQNLTNSNSGFNFNELSN